MQSAHKLNKKKEKEKEDMIRYLTCEWDRKKPYTSCEH